MAGLEDENNENKKGLLPWIKRFGVAAFLFFLLKGIAWILVFWLGFELFSC